MSEIINEGLQLLGILAFALSGAAYGVNETLTCSV